MTREASPGSPRPRWSLAAGLRRAGRWLLALPAPLVWGLIVIWMAVIWSLSSREGSPQTSSGAWAWIANLAHAPIFGVFGLLLAAALLRAASASAWPVVGPRQVVLVLGCVGLYALVDEWHQSLVPGRDPSAMDVLTDLVGAACVLWIVAYLGRRRASEPGLRLRLLAGILACAVVAALGV